MGIWSRIQTILSENLESGDRIFPYELPVALALDLLTNPHFSDLFSEILSLTFLIGISQIFGENVTWILTHVLIAIFAFRLGLSLTIPNSHGIQLAAIFTFTFSSSLLVVETWILGIPPIVPLEWSLFFLALLLMVISINAVCWIALSFSPVYWISVSKGSSLPVRIAGVFGYSALAGGVVASIFNFGITIQFISLIGLLYILISKSWSSWKLPAIHLSSLPDVEDIIYQSNRTVVSSALGFAGVLVIFFGFILSGYLLLFASTITSKSLTIVPIISYIFGEGTFMYSLGSRFIQFSRWVTFGIGIVFVIYWSNQAKRWAKFIANPNGQEGNLYLKRSASLILVLPIGLFISQGIIQAQFFFQYLSPIPLFIAFMIVVLSCIILLILFLYFPASGVWETPSSKEPIRLLSILPLQIFIIFIIKEHWFGMDEIHIEYLPILQLTFLLGGFLINAWWFNGASIMQIWTGLEKFYFSILIFTNIIALALVWPNFLNIYISAIVIGYLLIRVISLQNHPRILIIPRK